MSQKTEDQTQFVNQWQPATEAYREAAVPTLESQDELNKRLQKEHHYQAKFVTKDTLPWVVRVLGWMYATRALYCLSMLITLYLFADTGLAKSIRDYVVAPTIHMAISSDTVHTIAESKGVSEDDVNNALQQVALREFTIIAVFGCGMYSLIAFRLFSGDWKIRWAAVVMAALQAASLGIYLAKHLQDNTYSFNPVQIKLCAVNFLFNVALFFFLSIDPTTAKPARPQA